MAIDDSGRLAIRETITLAWRDVMAKWKIGLGLLLALYMPGLLLNVAGWLEPFEPSAGSPWPTLNTHSLPFALALFLFSLLIYVLLIRLFLLRRQDVFRLPAGTLLRYTLSFLWKGILVGLLLMLFSIALILPLVLVLAIVFAVIGAGFGDPSVPGPLVMFTPAIIILIDLVLFAVISVRYFPSLFGATVGQRIRLRESWRTMEGYTWRALLALAPAGLVGAVLYLIGIWAILRQVSAGPEAIFTFAQDMWWLSLVTLPLTYVCYGWAIAVLAQVYRDMWPLPDAPISPAPSETPA